MCDAAKRNETRQVKDRLDSVRSALRGSYDVARLLGRGSMASVYLAVRLSDSQTVAIKVLRPEFAVSIGAGRFHREISLLKRLRHPHILPLLDSEELGGELFYVMPCADGDSLGTRLEGHHRLEIEEALDIARQIGSALDYAHAENVMHRDIKPGNILFDQGRAVLCDFGVARAIVEASGENISSTGVIVGTPSYMSPEQATGRGQVDGRSDIYSLACVLYDMLVGEPPFTGHSAQAIMARQASESPPSIRVVRPDVPEHVERAVLAALEKRPERRPQTAGRFAEQLATP